MSLRSPITIDRECGLPSNQVHRLAADGLGRLWMAGPGGLGCHDGSHVRVFDRRHGLECAGLREVSLGAEGGLWIGTDLGLEAMDAELRPVAWQERLPWAYGLVGAVVPADGLVWVASSQGLVALSDDRAAGRLSLVAFRDVGFVRALVACAGGGVLALSASLGLVTASRDGLRRLRSPELPESGDIRQLAAAPDGEVLMGCAGGVFLADRALAGGRWLPRVAGAGEVSALVAQADECVVAFGRWLWSLPLRAGQGAPRELMTCPSRVNHLLGDALGNVWIACDSSGVLRLSCLRHAIEPIESGVPGAVYAIRPRPGGGLSLGGDGFAAELQWQADGSCVVGPGEELSSTVWDILDEDAGQGCWLATHGGLLRRAGDGRLRPVGDPGGLLSAPCRVLMKRGGALWVGTLHGLMRWQDGAASEVLGGDGLSLGYVYTLVEDQAGALWVGTLGRGLWRECGGKLQQLVGGPLTASGNTCAVVHDGAGRRVLVLQDERVVLIDLRPPMEATDDPALLAAAARRLMSAHPVAGWTARWIDGRRVAIGSSDGLWLLDIESGEVLQRINALHGASAWEFTNNRTLVEGADGRLYCGVNAGLMAVDLEALRGFQTPPQVRLGGLSWQGAAPVHRHGAWQLRPGKWTVEIRVFAAWLVDERSLRFRFRLAGFEEGWSALDVPPVVRFSSLPPGRYALQAQAFAPLTGHGPVAEVLQIEVQAHSWARIVWGSLAAWYEDRLGATMRNRQLLERHKRMEAEVADRIRALARANEELERRRVEVELTARTDALTGWGNRRAFDEHFQIELDRATRRGEPLGLLLVDVDHFKRYNDRYGHPAGDQCLRRLTTEMQAHLRAYDIGARYGGEEFAVLLPGADAATVAAIGRRLCQEVAARALPHADAPPGVVTLSIGGLSTRGGLPAELLQAVDAALYRAKSEGRNRFVAAAAAA